MPGCDVKKLCGDDGYFRLGFVCTVPLQISFTLVFVVCLFLSLS